MAPQDRPYLIRSTSVPDTQHLSLREISELRDLDVALAAIRDDDDTRPRVKVAAFNASL